MTKAELITKLADWSDDTVIILMSPITGQDYKGYWCNDVDKVFGSPASTLPDGQVFLKENEFYLYPTSGRIS